MKVLCKKDYKMLESNVVLFEQGELYERVLDQEIVVGYFIQEKSGRIIWFEKTNFYEHFYDENETINKTRTELIDKILK